MSFIELVPLIGLAALQSLSVLETDPATALKTMPCLAVQRLLSIRLLLADFGEDSMPRKGWNALRVDVSVISVLLVLRNVIHRFGTTETKARIDTNKAADCAEFTS